MNRNLGTILFALGITLSCIYAEKALAQTLNWSPTGFRPQDYDMGGNPTVSHGSANAGFIKSKVAQINGFGAYAASMAPGQYLGKGIKLSAYVKTTNVANYVGLWMRVDASGNQSLSFDNMGGRPITGTTDWEQHEIVLDVPENSTGIVFGILLAGTGEAWVDGLRSEPAARTWTVQNTGISQFIFSVKAVDENTVWAGAESGIYLRTTDGGATWKTGTVPGAETLTFNSIAAIDQNTAYFTGQNFAQGRDARIYKTSDGGANWALQYQNTGPGAFFNSIAFWDANNGLAVSDPVSGSFLIVTTTDGGATWNPVPAANIPAPFPNEYGGFGDAGGTTLFVEGTNNAWFGTGNASPIRVLKSTDQGRTWTLANTPLSTAGQAYGIHTLAFADSRTGFAGSFLQPYSKTANTLAKTTDGGQSWTAVSSFLPIDPATLVYVPHTNNSVVVVSSLQGFGYSGDGGETWKILNTQRCFALSFASPTAGYATGYQSGKIYKFASELSTAVAEQQSAQPEGFHLAQNYPNPFWSGATSRSVGNPSTTIRYVLPQPGLVTLKIFNTAGQELVTLVNQQQTAGEHTLQWHAENLPSSVYLYRLQAGEFVETKKMILLR